MIRNLKIAAAAAACALLVACNADKGPADAAIKAADQAITAAAPEAQKYIPDQLTAARDALKAAQDQFAKGDYKGALAAATELGTKAKDLVAAAAAKKDELTKAKDGLAGITKSWDEASAAFKDGNLMDALGKAKGLKEKGTEIMGLLGMAAPAAAP